MSAVRLPEADLLAVELPASPYPGLRPFEKREWTIFFGRETITDEIIGRLIERHVVALHGSSGSGKSSLVRAGVLPRLEQDYAGSGLAWRTSAMVPENDPLRRLAETLAAWHEDGTSADGILAVRRVLNRGREAGGKLAKMLRRAPREHHCLLVDQFEELFQLANADRDQASLFIDILVGLADAPPDGLYAVLTMRSDYLGACGRFAGLAEAVNRTQYLLPRMEHGDLLRAIREPAQLYGGEVHRELAERLIADARGEQDELPLIQHGLMLLWRDATDRDPRGEPPRLSLAHYTERTSLVAALSHHADTVLAGVAPDESTQRTVERLFRALTDINADGQAVRRRQTFADLCVITGATPNRLGAIIDAFRADGVSFLRPYAPEPVEPRSEIDISHEALIRCWSRIADPKTGWLQLEFRDGLIWRSLLVAADSFADDATNVLGEVTTDERDRWLAGRDAAWARRYGGGWERVLDLMAASRAARDHRRAREAELRRLAEEERLRAQELRAAWALGEEQRKRAEAEQQNRRSVTRALIVMLMLVGLSLLLTVLAFRQRQQAELARSRAELAQAAAMAARTEAERAQGLALAARIEEERARTEADAARLQADRAARVSMERTASLLAAFGWDSRNLVKAGSDPNSVRQSLIANEALKQVARASALERARAPRLGKAPGAVAGAVAGGDDRERLKSITVEYFPKNVDGSTVEAALLVLGFTVRKPATRVPDIATNSIWFGTPVGIEDVKLVALTLIRAGVQIRAIRPIQDYLVAERNLPLIQVGADVEVMNNPPLTVEAILNASSFSR